MAKPKIFISSTCYDLRDTRDVLDDFIYNIGYESIRSDEYNIPYDKDKLLEDYCYSSVGQCNILISIISNNFGSPSNSDKNLSISYKEREVARKKGILCYTFVNSSIKGDFFSYKENIDNPNIDIQNLKFSQINNIKILEYLYEIEQERINNILFYYDKPSEICSILKEQWAGLFQNYIANRLTDEQNKLSYISDVNNYISTLHSIVFSTDNSPKIILNSDYFQTLKKVTGINFLPIFFNKNELIEILELLGFQRNISDVDPEECITFLKEEVYLIVNKKIFHKDGNLNYESNLSDAIIVNRL